MNGQDLCPELTDLVADEMPPGGCIECLATGDTWVHLRYCVVCKETRCCDSSRNRHARTHWKDTGHAVVRSKEPGEKWAFCFGHDAAIRFPTG
jgi:hypothetical protein